MTCDELFQAFQEHLDGVTQSALCQALRAHMEQCQPCHVVVDNLRQTITLYQASEVVPLPADVRSELRAILRRRWAARFPQAEGVC